MRKALEDGQFEPLRLREGDELHELAGLLDQALSRMKDSAAARGGESSSTTEAFKAA